MTVAQEGQAVAMNYMRHAAWGTIGFALVLFVCNVLVIILAGQGYLPLWMGFFYFTFSFHLGYTIVHEAVHGSIACKDRSLFWIQNLLGYVFAQFLSVPFTAHKKVHLAHHQYTNIPGKDPDLELAVQNPLGLIVHAPRVFLSQRLFYIHHWWHKVPASERRIFVLENLISIIWRLAVGYVFSWQVMIVLTLLPLVPGAAWLAFVFAWLVHTPFKQVGRYVDTVTYKFPVSLDTVITVLWGFQNYHSVHHLYPKVPFYRYRKVFNAIENEMLEHQAPIVRVWQVGKALE